MSAIATATLKSTGLTYLIYSVKEYAVWTIDGKPTHCTCKSRKYNPNKLCKHMQSWLAENAPVVEAPASTELKTVFNSEKEEFEYKLGAYGKKVAYGWLYEKRHEKAMKFALLLVKYDIRFQPSVIEAEQIADEAFSKPIESVADRGVLNNGNAGFSILKKAS